MATGLSKVRAEGPLLSISVFSYFQITADKSMWFWACDNKYFNIELSNCWGGNAGDSCQKICNPISERDRTIVSLAETEPLEP